MGRVLQSTHILIRKLQTAFVLIHVLRVTFFYQFTMCRQKRVKLFGPPSFHLGAVAEKWLFIPDLEVAAWLPIQEVWTKNEGQTGLPGCTTLASPNGQKSSPVSWRTHVLTWQILCVQNCQRSDCVSCNHQGQLCPRVFWTGRVTAVAVFGSLTESCSVDRAVGADVQKTDVLRRIHLFHVGNCSVRAVSFATASFCTSCFGKKSQQQHPAIPSR